MLAYCSASFGSGRAFLGVPCAAVFPQTLCSLQRPPCQGGNFLLSFKGFPRQPVLWPGETLLLKCIELFCRALPCKWILGFGWVFSFLVLLCSCSFLFVPLNYRKGERTYYRGTLSGNGLFCRSCAKTTALFTSEFLPFLQGYQPQGGTSYGQVTINQYTAFEKFVCHGTAKGGRY